MTDNYSSLNILYEGRECMSTLGEKIRTLRNERKLTLVQLAGNKMTKGMLSLIENNKATPSMENLTYIAEKLNVPVAELLDDYISKEEDLLKAIKEIVREEQPFEFFAKDIWELYDASQPFSEQLSGARLAIYFGKSAYFMNESIAPFFTHAEKVYINIHATDLWVDTVLEHVSLFINDGKFEVAKEFLSMKKEELTQFSIKPSPMRLLKWYFYLAAIQLALGSYSDGMETIKESMELSNKHHVYYLMNQLLRMGTFVEMMTTFENYEKRYLQKLKQYMVFSEDQDLQVYIPFVEAHFHTTFQIDLPRAEILLNEIDFDKAPDIYIPFLYLERGKIAFYKNEYDKALRLFENVKFLDSPYHPIDQSALASYNTYFIKIARKTNRNELANQAIREGKQIYQQLPDSFYKEQFFNSINNYTS